MSSSTRAARQKGEYHDLVNLAACLTLISGLGYFAWNTVALGAEPPALQSDSLVGVWGSENVFGPSVRGELIIDARRPEWRAKIAGHDVPIQRNRGAIAFSVPDNAGEFRGHASADRRATTITGDWIQPIGIGNNNRYATPVQFSKTAPTVWTGQVVPLDDRVSFYVSIQRAQDGSLTAFIRNPEFNHFRRRVYRADVDGTNVALTNTQKSDDSILGTYDPALDRLLLPTLDSHPPLNFTRRKDSV